MADENSDIIPISFRYHSEGIQNAFWSYFLTLKRISSWQKSFLLTSSRVFQIIGVVEGLKFFHFVLHSPCTTLLCEVRLRFERKNENFLIFILFFTHLALLCYREVRLRFGRKNENFLIFILFFTHLALLCCREVRLRFGRKNENFSIFILFFTHLALTLNH